VILTRTREELERALAGLRPAGPLSLVPTMGFLHEGHLSLVDLAQEAASTVAVSVFVNPLQFGPTEDFGRYPRDPERDLALLEARRADLVFAPEVTEMYPAGPPVVTVQPGAMGDVLCGAYRPGHFAGVLTVVARLFGLFRPDLAVFGSKDFQQATLVRRMVTDLELRVDVRMAPIVREPDGLAMSSRNAYLSSEERAQAVGLWRSLAAALEAFRNGERSADALLRIARARLHGFPLLEPQYVEVVDAGTLEALARVEEGAVLAIAAFAGGTRLIDNVVLA
jgi:pantoate--beta-alanine ligase